MFLFLLISADTSAVKEVLVEGVASYEGGRKDVARDRAIKDALRKAVEQGVGTLISSETVVENYEVLKDRIYSKAEGYVAEYRVLRERAEDGLYRVLVRAKVKLGDIKRDLRAIGILVEERGRPRTMVLIGDEDVRAMVEERLLSLNFPLVDYETVARNTEKDVLDAALKGDRRLARKVAMRNGAEIYVIGSLRSEEKLYEGKKVYHVRLRLKAVESATGEMLASVFVSKKVPFDESEAKRYAVEEAVERLTDAVLSRWKAGVVIHLKVEGIPPAKVEALKNEIYGKVRGIRAVYERERYGKYVLLELTTDTSPQEVLNDLQRIRHLKVVEYEGQSVRARYRP